MPQISIGMPVYNGAAYLRESIDSILGQSFTDFELIISNNASEDQTDEICREYVRLDERVRYFRQPVNLGAARNHNFVLAQARHDLFRWMPHDDRCAPEYLARCLEVMRQDPETVLVYPQTQLINSQGEQIEDYQEQGRGFESDRASERFRWILLNIKLCLAVQGLIRTPVLRRCGGIGPYPGADNVLLAELSLYGRFRQVPQKLFYRRMHPESSLAARPNRQAVAAWFDPARANKYYMHRSRHSWEYFRAISGSRLGLREKCRCLGILWKEYVSKFWRHIAGEIKFAIKYRLHLVPRQAVIEWSRQRRVTSHEH